MKKSFITLLTMAALGISAYSQTCCKIKTEGNEFAMLTARKDFQKAHLAPTPFHFEATSGAMTTFNTPDGKTGNAFEVKATQKTKNVIIMVHEWWGLNDYIKREAESLQKELGNVDVYAIDLYDGEVATDPQTAGKLMGGMNPERASNIVKGLISKIGADANLVTIGWCMGGSWSFQAALLAGNQTKGCVMYYGFPEKNVEKMKTLASDVLFIQATKDGFIKNEDVETFSLNLQSVKKTITIKKFEADHAFANPSNPKFEKEMASQAHEIALAYIKKAFKL